MSVIFSRPSFSAGRFSLRGILALLPVFMVVFSHPALAQTLDGLSAAVSLGDVFCNVSGNTLPILDVFNYFAFTAGAYFALQGILHMKGHADNPSQHPKTKVFIYFAVAGALLSLPAFEGMLIDTFFTSPGPGGATQCKVGDAAGNGSSVTLDVMLTNLVSNIKEPMISMLSAIAWVMGLYLIVRGLMKATKHGTDPKMHSQTNIYMSFVIGAALCAVGSSLTMLLASVFGDTGITDSNVTQWAMFKGLGGDLSQFQKAITAALTFFQLVGFISFIRGWTIMRQAVEGHGQHTISQGLTHIIGGVIAINIYAFVSILDKTFGTNFIT